MNDLIYVKKGCVPKKHCDLLIKNFELNKNYVPGTVGRASENNTKLKACVEEFIDINNGNSYDKLFWSYLNIACGEYIRKYPFLETLNPWGFFETYKLQKYKPNEGYFDLHAEVTGGEETQGSAANRMLVWMIYLNDVTEGGYTIWPIQERTIAPRCGDIVIWPAFWTHPHRGITSKTQTKYILTGWWEYKKLTPKEEEDVQEEIDRIKEDKQKKHIEWLKEQNKTC